MNFTSLHRWVGKMGNKEHLQGRKGIELGRFWIDREKEGLLVSGKD